MTAPEKIHQQSRVELVAAFVVGFLVTLLAIALIIWAASAPTTDPRNEPRPGITQFEVQPYSA